MEWRLNETEHSDWVIEYKKSFLSGWNQVTDRDFQWEPDEPAYFSTKQEAAEEMAKLMVEYG